ncbi:complement C1q tumor necrosis factor-related protein 6-like [Dreissena polymorpha]|uniref:C1q domain-containing protein n=1 Tax=Dreissena polymorpha TaxID=45954 RepID=A0A9D4DE76_DREPO|nr:complement C1q tumor necrosis factor-related protein 6-like [Dreissena polymorpha]XP_052234820.1 complement C1q tumor necrosis factor-related protein 6-like [Dreissena polymorpha]XP_052234821.1 complement C1q tumor necrosis factor-related protein 6-like [Dreissena polymorpha]XP_052234822.1 complement C1q tumor necrosis factor-related protein 6-like [Dreissena polymorpha]KAH3747719.1 hypothetical protein DPMN_182148 [Dreissena polymorpha]
MFQFHTLAHQDKAAWLELYHNQQYIASVYGKTTNDYAMAGNSVILQVNKGDQVYIRAVKARFGIATGLYDQPDEIYSTFSGYLITAIATETPVGGK